MYLRYFSCVCMSGKGRLCNLSVFAYFSPTSLTSVVIMASSVTFLV